jgi:two-component system LytT family response regulator
MSINCIIIEDEPLAQERIKGYIQKVPFVHLLAAFDNTMDALVFLKSGPVDLIFLDINLGAFSGIQLLETVNITSQVIITTAYQEYALKGFDLQVADYLLKPFTFDRFLQAVDRVQSNPIWTGAAPDKKFVFIKTEYRLEKVFLDDILYIEGMRDYRRVYTAHKQIMTLKTFREFEREISPGIICRVHKSFMVAIDKIDSVEKDRIKVGEKIIPISETYKKLFLQIIH